MASFLEKKHFHFGQWRLATHKRLSLLLLFFLSLHGLALMALKVEPPLEKKLTSLRTPVIQVYIETEETKVGDIAFQLRYQDPSSVAQSSTLLSVPPEVPLSLGSEPVALSEMISNTDHLIEIDALTVTQKAENSLQNPLFFWPARQENAETVSPKTGNLVLEEEAARRLVSPLPELPAQSTDQPLLPTVILANITPLGNVENVLVEISSGNPNWDNRAILLAKQLRFSPKVEASSVWTTFTFYWLQLTGNE